MRDIVRVSNSEQRYALALQKIECKILCCILGSLAIKLPSTYFAP